MRTAECQSCHKSIPLNQAYSIAGLHLCEECAQAELAALGGKSKSSAASKLVDPTVCYGCHFDNGSTDLPKLQSGLPVCENCKHAFLHRPYPAWVRASFAALLLVTLISFIHNWRFVEAFRDMKRGERAARSGHMKEASAFLSNAAKLLPEVEDLKLTSEFYQGLELVSEDRAAEALPLLKHFAERHPGPADQTVAQAELVAAFTRKDYDEFLSKAQSILSRQSQSPLALASVSSAWACKFAVSNNDEYKQRALDFLARAKAAPGASTVLSDFPDRIEHRLATREILEPAEYKRRYPNGWKKGEAAK